MKSEVDIALADCGRNSLNEPRSHSCVSSAVIDCIDADIRDCDCDGVRECSLSEPDIAVVAVAVAVALLSVKESERVQQLRD